MSYQPPHPNSNASNFGSDGGGRGGRGRGHRGRGGPRGGRRGTNNRGGGDNNRGRPRRGRGGYSVYGEHSGSSQEAAGASATADPRLRTLTLATRPEPGGSSAPQQEQPDQPARRRSLRGRMPVNQPTEPGRNRHATRPAPPMMVDDPQPQQQFSGTRPASTDRQRLLRQIPVRPPDAPSNRRSLTSPPPRVQTKTSDELQFEAFLRTLDQNYPSSPSSAGIPAGLADILPEGMSQPVPRIRTPPIQRAPPPRTTQTAAPPQVAPDPVSTQIAPRKTHFLTYGHQKEPRRPVVLPQTTRPDGKRFGGLTMSSVRASEHRRRKAAQFNARDADDVQDYDELNAYNSTSTLPSLNSRDERASPPVPSPLRYSPRQPY